MTPASSRRRPADLPELSLVEGPLGGVADVDLVVAAVRVGAGGPELGAEALEVLTRSLLTPSDVLSRPDVRGEVGQLAEIPVLGDRPDGPTTVLLLGVGALDDGSPNADLRRAGAALGRRLKGRTPTAETVAVALPPGASTAHLRDFTEGLLLGLYRQPRTGRKAIPPDEPRLRDVRIVGPTGGEHQDALRRGVVTATATTLARDLANTPSNVKDPAWLAARAVDVARAAGLEFRVRDERELAAEGFGGIVAVGAGSVRPPRFVELTYTPATVSRRTPHVVLVGKGITFDSGGLSLKPRDAMVPMKTDMSGAGAVIAVMSALGALGVRARVTGLLAIAENLPSGSAARPGDVITHFGGTTSEVINTDAEGRLVLADALAYADRTLAPDLVVDIATLTGAASLGLGKRHGALFTADDTLAADLLAASTSSGERLWRMPLTEDYRSELESEVADLRHTARTPGGAAGATTAALFLRAFVGDRRWAHLDVAGPARAESDEHEVSKGGTGFGARVLLRWLEVLR